MQPAIFDIRHGSAATAATTDPGSTPGIAAPLLGHPQLIGSTPAPAPPSPPDMAEPASAASLRLSETLPEQAATRRGRFARPATNSRRRSTSSSPVVSVAKKILLKNNVAVPRSSSASRTDKANGTGLTYRFGLVPTALAGTPAIPKMPRRDHSPMPMQEALPTLGGFENDMSTRLATLELAARQNHHYV